MAISDISDAGDYGGGGDSLFGNGSISGLFNAGSGVVSAVGSLIGGFQTADADRDAAKSFRTAARMDETNKFYAGEAGGLEALSAARTIQRTIGTEKNAVAGGGFADAGTAQDLLRSSTQQGALTLGKIGLQTALNVNSYEAQAESARSQAAASDKAAGNAEMGGFFGAIKGVGQAAAAILPFFL